MDKESAIFSRRSIRAYDSSKRATEGQITDLLDAAMHAPSAMNRQPWEFIAVTDPARLAGIMEIHPYCESLADAGAAIIVCGDLDSQLKCPDGGYCQFDCSAAAQNILLRAKEIGLDTCWCGIAPDGERISAFSKFFGLPKNIEPMALIIVGYGAETPEPDPGRFRREKIHFQTWCGGTAG